MVATEVAAIRKANWQCADVFLIENMMSAEWVRADKPMIFS
jgi:hypothetical protein